MILVWMMWSNGFPDTVDLLPRPAVPGTLICLVLLPVLLPVLLLCGVPWTAAVALLAAAGWLQWQSERRAAVRRALLDASGQWWVDRGDGVLCRACLTHHWLLPWPRLVGLRFHTEGPARAATLLLWRGRTGPVTLRHLCVRLRHPREAGTGGGQALQRGQQRIGNGDRKR